MDVVGRGHGRGALSPFLSPLLSPYRYSVMALTNVAEMVEGRTQRRMLEEGVLKPLQKLAASPLVDVRREVARAFALFASKRDSHQDILQCGGLQQMVSFLRSDDPKCERFGALGIANLGTACLSFGQISLFSDT